MRHAEDSLRFYSADATINGLYYPRHEEETAVATFVRSTRVAAKAFLEDPLGALLIPNWNRVISALPNFLDELNDAVQKDNNM
jgi:glucosyl-3-phosphoglycerate synthase